MFSAGKFKLSAWSAGGKDLIRIQLFLFAPWLVAAFELTSSGANTIENSKLPPPASRTVDFTKDIKPIFDTHCGSCHGVEKQRSGFRIDLKAAALKGGENYAPAIIPGKSAESPLIHFVAGL